MRQEFYEGLIFSVSRVELVVVPIEESFVQPFQKCTVDIWAIPLNIHHKDGLVLVVLIFILCS